MTERFRNKYRVSSSRLQTWDYTTHAAYFVTICTAGREHYFGEIVHHVETPCMASLPSVGSSAVMQLSELGKIAESEWLKTPDLRPDMNLILGKFVVMPDHFHAVIIIGPNDFNRSHHGIGNGDGNCRRDAMHGVSTTITDGVPTTAIPQTTKFGPQRKNLGSIIRGFKSAVTTHARKNNINFGWQARFHDRIIRDDQEFIRIEKYIENNPAKWISK